MLEHPRRDSHFTTLGVPQMGAWVALGGRVTPLHSRMTTAGQHSMLEFWFATSSTRSPKGQMMSILELQQKEARPLMIAGWGGDCSSFKAGKPSPALSKYFRKGRSSEPWAYAGGPEAVASLETPPTWRTKECFPGSRLLNWKTPALT